MNVMPIGVFKTLVLRNTLTKESSELTTFQTFYTRYRYLRMPFGICSSQEVFQKRMEGILGEIPSVHIIFDDILSAESKIQEHYEMLRGTLITDRVNGTKYNPRKLQRCFKEVKIFGELLTKRA